MAAASVPSRGDFDALSALTSALAKLDPFGYWTVPTGSGSRADVVVAGVTGVFLIAAYDRPGVMTVERGKPRVAKKAVPGLRNLKKDAKGLAAVLTASQVFAQVEPVVCLTRATVGAPRTVGGVRVVGVDALTKDLTGRPATVPHARAQRVVRALGMRLAGDQRRHFVA